MHEALEERFGFTDVKMESPNFRRTDVWNPQGLGTGVIQVTWLVTDGKHDASGYDGTSADAIERLKTAFSEIRHTVTDASWTVVCSYTKRDTEIRREVVLYTEQRCWKKIYQTLEDFLSRSDKYGRFEDIVEEFMTE